MISGSHIACWIGSAMPVLVPGNQMWSAEVEADELDGTTAEDDGSGHPEDGVKQLTANIMFVVDITSGSPFAGISVGTQITDLGLYTHVEDDTPAYNLPVAKVFRSTYRGEIRGRVTYECVVKSVGPFEENI